MGKLCKEFLLREFLLRIGAELFFSRSAAMRIDCADSSPLREAVLTLICPET